MKNVLFIFPTTWDRRQLEACGGVWRERYAVQFAGPTDETCPSDFDVLGFIDGTTRSGAGRPDGVASSSDYPGAVAAAAVATGMGLPGARPQAVLLCSHKYYARWRFGKGPCWRRWSPGPPPARPCCWYTPPAAITRGGPGWRSCSGRSSTFPRWA